jgi:putative tryptophan/tyrosine transport system substrate-binding protein
MQKEENIRWADTTTERMPDLAAELVNRNVDVVLVSSSLAANAALKATTTIPIVQASGASPVGTGAARSLARPQGNLTGFTNQSEDVSGKLLELLLMAVPQASRVGVLMVSGAPVTEPQLRQVQDAARSLGVDIHPVSLSKAAALESAFGELAREHVSGLVVFSAALIVSLSREIVELAATAKLPTIYPYPNFARRGGLMAYGTDHTRQFYAAARFVDRVLKGTKPGDLPIEQPTKLDFLLNLKTANALGLTIPPALLARADQVIE